MLSGHKKGKVPVYSPHVVKMENLEERAMIGKTKRVWLMATMMAGAVFQARVGNIVADPDFEIGTPASYRGPLEMAG